MNQKLKNLTEMSGDVQQLFERQRTFWSHLVPVSESVEAVTETNREIALSALVQADGTSGVTEAKDLALQLSAGKSYTMGRRVLAWAKKNARPDVAQAVDLNRAELTQGAEQDLLLRHRLIHQYATEHKASLADYLVTDSNLDEQETATNTFAALRAGKSEKQEKRIYSTARLEELAGKLRGILDVLDNEVEGLIANKEFTDAYFIARRITDRKATRTAKPDAAGA